MTWFKVDAGFPDHRKTLSLCQLLGNPLALAYPILLWAWASEKRQDGKLLPGDVDRACRWRGKKGHLESSLRLAGFIDADGSLHGWLEFSGSELAKIARKKSLNQKAYAERFRKKSDKDSDSENRRQTEKETEKERNKKDAPDKPASPEPEPPWGKKTPISQEEGEFGEWFRDRVAERFPKVPRLVPYPRGEVSSLHGLRSSGLGWPRIKALVEFAMRDTFYGPKLTTMGYLWSQLTKIAGEFEAKNGGDLGPAGDDAPGFMGEDIDAEDADA